MSPSEIAQFIVWAADDRVSRDQGRGQDRVSTLYGVWVDVGLEIQKHMLRIREEDKQHCEEEKKWKG